VTLTLLHLLAAYGLCFALINDKIPLVCRFLRYSPTFNRMLSCTFCTGFHCGWIVLFAESQRHVLAGGDVPGWEGLPDLLLWGFAGAAFCYTVDTAVQWLELPATDEGP